MQWNTRRSIIRCWADTPSIPAGLADPTPGGFGLDPRIARVQGIAFEASRALDVLYTVETCMPYVAELSLSFESSFLSHRVMEPEAVQVVDDGEA